MNKTIRSRDFFTDNKTTKNKHASCYVLGLNLRTPDNIGALIRLADNIGAQKALFTLNISDFSLKKIRRRATTAAASMEWEITNIEAIKQQIPEDYVWLAIETSEQATNLFETQLPEKVVFVAGNESYGLSKEELAYCDQSVYIPMPGHTVSMNVAQATAVTMFEWYRQTHYKK